MTENINLDDLWKRIWDTIKGLTQASEEESRQWLIAAVLRIWASNKLYSNIYLQAVNQFSGKKYSSEELKDALKLAGNAKKKLSVPAFFTDVVRLDALHGTDISRNLTETLGSIMFQFALINNDFTIEEANTLQEILDSLNKYCDGMHIKSYDFQLWDPGRITPLGSDYEKPEKKSSLTLENNSLPGIFSALKTSSILGLSPAEKKSEANIANLFTDLFGGGNAEAVSNPIISDSLFVNDNSSAAPLASQTEKAEEEKAKAPQEEAESLESVMEELNSLVGLDQIKTDVQSLMNFIRICQIREKRGLNVPKVSYHLVFTGNPGTGKTTVARIVAKLYKLMGILPQGQLIETDRSGLVAGFLGQTAIKTQEVIQKAMGGVLFIDEAYALANDDQDTYGKEAIETILKAMEDHRDELVVIVAGYDDLMHKFIDSNPGLRSRFNKYFQFPDYDSDALFKIMQRYCDKNGYKLDAEAEPFLKEKLDEIYAARDRHFGNARFVRNVFETAIHFQADRLANREISAENPEEFSDEELTLLSKDDILSALEAQK